MVDYYFVFLIFVIALVGYKLCLLTASGGLASILIGLLIYSGFGLKGLIILGVFFGSSSFYSVYKREKKTYMNEVQARGHRRDFVQVIANGGIPATLGILQLFFPYDLWIYSFIAATACGTSDTWSSEIGSLSKQKPISIRTLRRVSPGISGAFSMLGLLSALLGALFISYIGSLLFSEITISQAFLLGVIGFIGQWIDTLLGGFAQSQFRCTVCHIETEKNAHCDQKTERIKGYQYIQNDVVNFISIFSAALIAVFVFIDKA